MICSLCNWFGHPFHRSRPLYYTLLLSSPLPWSLSKGSISLQKNSYYFQLINYKCTWCGTNPYFILLFIFFIPFLLFFLSLSFFPPHPFLFWNLSSYPDSLSFYRDEHQRDEKEVKMIHVWSRMEYATQLLVLPLVYVNCNAHFIGYLFKWFFKKEQFIFITGFPVEWLNAV